MKSSAPFLTVPTAVLLGSIMISISVLISGGIIKVGPKQTAAQPTASAAPAAQQQQPAVTLATVKNVLNSSAIKFGDANRKLIVVEVADPSCPYCSIAAGKNPELNKQAGPQFTLVTDGGNYVPPVPEIARLVREGKASFAYIYTPGHGNGEMATKALYCANEKGKFWEAHDLLMSSSGYDLINNQVKNDKTKSEEMASFLQTVLDPAAVKACLDSGKYDNRLQEDVSLARSLGISGTPGFYLNTTPFSGAYNFKDMESVVKAALGS